MKDLKIIEQNNQRVLTTAQLAEAYGTDTKIINRNFQRNTDRYVQGKHFLALSGEDLRNFKGSRQFDDSLKFTSILYLWTEKGAWLHAKSLNTDEAWDAYEMLVDDYYKHKQQIIDTAKLSPELQMFKQIFDTVAQKQLEDAKRDEKLTQLETGIETIKETFLKKDDDWRKSINTMLNSAARKIYGDYRQLRVDSYQLLEDRARCDLNRRLQNYKFRLEESGATKTKINQATKMDVIEQDPRLKEIYTTIVKEFSISSIAIKKKPSVWTTLSFNLQSYQTIIT
ncbi:ORF6N domain-containing protein [Anaerobacillus sp. CMMVII]|uniref:ORF6N domain-containing protein n=1 Tax=Anaerobacillus sp. CMMVII TaxID=2755588 RepID=UPI0021B720C8|nr:ORF6N domain-containing protein [Anaerobacillus sp. CMMVII]MCT8138619.1 ORF6N domain-containing protein [Anaerobacillus sp. CMMVII]